MSYEYVGLVTLNISDNQEHLRDGFNQEVAKDKYIRTYKLEDINTAWEVQLNAESKEDAIETIKKHFRHASRNIGENKQRLKRDSVNIAIIVALDESISNYGIEQHVPHGVQQFTF